MPLILVPFPVCCQAQSSLDASTERLSSCPERPGLFLTFQKRVAGDTILRPHFQSSLHTLLWIVPLPAVPDQGCWQEGMLLASAEVRPPLYGNAETLS